MVLTFSKPKSTPKPLYANPSVAHFTYGSIRYKTVKNWKPKISRDTKEYFGDCN